MGYKITVKQGNLVEEEADFIVNASNTKLLLGSGVSMAFKKHCKIKLQKEMNNLILQHPKELVQGDVVLTSSGDASNFKYALHALVMNYNKGVRGVSKNPSLETIQTILENIFLFLNNFVKKNKKVKIVLPLLGCGVGGLNKNDLLTLYKTFFLKDILFECEVVVYGYTLEDYNLIKKTLISSN